MVFKKSHIPWNKGIWGLRSGEKNSNWKGGKPRCLTCDKLLSKYSAKYCKSHHPITKKTRMLYRKRMLGNTYAKGKSLGNTHGFTKGFTPWNKGKHYPAVSGKNNVNWKGGVSKHNRTERQNIMSSLEYKLWRKSVFERDNYACVLCKAKGNLNADHIKPFPCFLNSVSN